MEEREFRILSRGGQGAVTAANILVQAAVVADLYAQAVPSFGQERKGAPVFTFARLSRKPIESHTYVYEPDIVVVFDPSLMELGIDPLEGIHASTTLVLNDKAIPQSLKGRFAKTGLVDAWGITREIVGNAPPNAAMLGAIAKTTGLLEIADITQAIRETLNPRIVEANVRCAEEAYERTVIHEG